MLMIGCLLLISFGAPSVQAQPKTVENVPGASNANVQDAGNANAQSAGVDNAPAKSSAKITSSESKLIFKGSQTDALQRTFSVEGNPLPKKINVVLHDLVEADTGVVVLSSNIKVTPAREEGANQEVYNVTVSGATKPGHYVGVLDLTNADQQPEAKLLSVQLDVTLNGASAVETDVNSKSLTLRLHQSFGDIAQSVVLKLHQSFWNPSHQGQLGPTVEQAQTSSSSGLREYVLDLVQSGEQEANVSSASVLAMRANAGNDLPPGVVRVSSHLPFKIAGGGTAPLKLVAAGDDLDAGEYNGTLQVNIAEQKAPVKIPIKIFIKNGPLLALVVLIGGLLTASLFGWWNSKGKAIRDLVKPIQQLEVEINTGKNLQIEERKEATRLLRQAIDGIETGDSPEEVKKKFDAAQAYVTTTKKAAEDFITTKLDALVSKTAALTPGKTIRERLIATLQEIKTNITEGKYLRLEDAQTLVLDPLKGLERQVSAFDAIVKRFSEVAVEKRAEVEKKMDDAATPTDLRQALADAGITVAPESGVSFDAAPSGLPADAARERFQLSLQWKLKLSLGAALIAIIAFLFILAVGWISIYVKSDTFGANPMDYITLFLWGATAEALRGQTINMSTLKTVIKEPSPTP
jgi:hypothetical protein